MDPARFDHPSDSLSDADRDARIEQLLLSGLDRYFSGDYEQAINLWTRVLFFDRHHDRARAYIERARSAQAEKQREAEALLHEGLDAFGQGDVARARALLSDALAQGAPRDLALGVLDRLDRLGTTTTPTPPRRPPPRPWTPRTPGPVFAPDDQHPLPPAPPRRTTLAALVALGIAAVAVWALVIGEVADSSPARPDAAMTISRPDPVPVPAAAEVFLARGRQLLSSGRLRAALAELERVPPGAAERAEADRLRGAIQRELLAVAAADTPPRPPSSPAPSTVVPPPHE